MTGDFLIKSNRDRDMGSSWRERKEFDYTKPQQAMARGSDLLKVQQEPLKYLKQRGNMLQLMFLNEYVFCGGKYGQEKMRVKPKHY